MKEEKVYKCACRHCCHPEGKVSAAEAIRVNNRYWHKDCYETNQIVLGVRDRYLEEVNSAAVISQLTKIINDIVYGRKLENKSIPKWESNLEAARYLNFALDFAIRNHISISFTPGLYYLINDFQIKKAYKKQKEIKVQREMKESMKHEEAEKPVNVPTSTENKKTERTGFASILG